jgi:hypothetical protein
MPNHVVKLKSLLRQFECRHHELVNICEESVSQMTTDMFVCRNHNPVPSHSCFITGFVTRVTQRVSHIEQELSTLP